MTNEMGRELILSLMGGLVKENGARVKNGTFHIQTNMELLLEDM